jgi:hypothetical protein
MDDELPGIDQLLWRTRLLLTPIAIGYQWYKQPFRRVGFQNKKSKYTMAALEG